MANEEPRQEWAKKVLGDTAIDSQTASLDKLREDLDRRDDAEPTQRSGLSGMRSSSNVLRGYSW